MEAPQRKIVGFMVVAGIITLIGEYVEQGPGGSLSPSVAATLQANPAEAAYLKAQAAAAGSPQPFRVILGVTAGSALLVLLSETGAPGAQFAQGLATLTLMVAVLVKGGPVWQALQKALQGVGAANKPTTPTTPTTPTAGSVGASGTGLTNYTGYTAGTTA